MLMSQKNSVRSAQSHHRSGLSGEDDGLDVDGAMLWRRGKVAAGRVDGPASEERAGTCVEAADRTKLRCHVLVQRGVCCTGCAGKTP